MALQLANYHTEDVSFSGRCKVSKNRACNSSLHTYPYINFQPSKVLIVWALNHVTGKILWKVHNQEQSYTGNCPASYTIPVQAVKFLSYPIIQRSLQMKNWLTANNSYVKVIVVKKKKKQSFYIAKSTNKDLNGISMWS